LKKETYLFDTHALVFWNNKETVSGKFINFLITKCNKVVFMFLSFDRLLIVQANQNIFPIVTKDRDIAVFHDKSKVVYTLLILYFGSEI